jgi:hypothetical protein
MTLGEVGAKSGIIAGNADRGDLRRLRAEQLIQDERKRAAREHRADHVRELRPKARDGNAGNEGERAHRRHVGIDAVQVNEKVRERAAERGATLDVDAEKVSDLRCDDGTLRRR